MGRKKLTIEDMQVLASEKEGKCLSEEYIDNVSKLNWKCSKGHIFSLSAARVKAGDWCKDCKKGNKEIFIKPQSEILDLKDRAKDEVVSTDASANFDTIKADSAVLLDNKIEDKKSLEDDKLDDDLNNMNAVEISDIEKPVEARKEEETENIEKKEKTEENDNINLLILNLRNQIAKLESDKKELEESINYLKERDETLTRIRRFIISQPNGDIMWKSLETGQSNTYDY